jgi:hypothetical protein
MERFFVNFTIDGHSLDSKLSSGSNNTARDLSTMLPELIMLSLPADTAAYRFAIRILLK